MTGTQIHEALHAVADAVEAPAPDRLTFQRLVQQERRRHRAARVAIGGAVAACVALAVTAVVVPLGGSSTPQPAPPAPPEGQVTLDRPIFLRADGSLGAIDTRGVFRDLGYRVEEVVGSTPTSVYAFGPQSGLVEVEATLDVDGWHGGSEPIALTDGPSQSAQVSGNGHWLGWVDLEERLHVRNLDTGEEREPVRLKGSGYLVDLSDAGFPLVSDDRGLVLLHPDVDRVVASGIQWDATLAGDRLAVPDLGSTLVYEVTDSGGVDALWEVPGSGRLSPGGDAIVSVGDEESGDAWLTVLGEDPVRLDVEGMLHEVSWADDNTALVSSFVHERLAVFACEVGGSTTCTRLDVGTPRSLSFVR